jgi:SnoaL-like polyketide cyclase
VQTGRAAVTWTATATFAGPGRFQGLRPNGAKVELQGVDIAEVNDGQMVGNTAFVDGATIARQLGAMPPDGSLPERALKGLLNAKVAVEERLRR